MSDSLTSGLCADNAIKQRGKPCKKSPNGKHKWKRQGLWPSEWDECIYCKECIYYK
jgi:NAD-dependent dihydropyrimidine dehydrogenase PreA subunit